MRFRPAQDARVLPGRGLSRGQAVGDHDLLNGAVEAGDLSLQGPGGGISGHRRPVAFEALEGFAAQQQRVRSAQPFGVLGVEAFVFRVSVPAVIKHGHHIVSRTFVIAVQSHDVADDQFAHSISLLLSVSQANYTGEAAKHCLAQMEGLSGRMWGRSLRETEPHTAQKRGPAEGKYAIIPDCIQGLPFTSGEVPEWLNGAVSKTVVGPVPTVGSNPTLSAERKVL